jgi:hypothetical protein
MVKIDVGGIGRAWVGGYEFGIVGLDMCFTVFPGNVIPTKAVWSRYVRSQVLLSIAIGGAYCDVSTIQRAG